MSARVLPLFLLGTILVLGGCSHHPGATMNRDPAFGDYSPKESEDTASDYLSGRGDAQRYAEFVQGLPAAEPRSLKRLLDLLDEHVPRAGKNPGRYEEGNMVLGADPKEYRPSLEELMAAATGDRIRQAVQGGPREEVRRQLAENRITRRTIEYSSFTFRHMDVMGSGRFFYASGPKRETVSLE